MIDENFHLQKGHPQKSYSSGDSYSIISAALPVRIRFEPSGDVIERSQGQFGKVEPFICAWVETTDPTGAFNDVKISLGEGSDEKRP